MESTPSQELAAIVVGAIVGLPIERTDVPGAAADNTPDFAIHYRTAPLPSILPGCAIATLGHKFWPDFVITYRGKAGLIEVDGGHHVGRALSDQSRDHLLQDAGISLVGRIPADEATNPEAATAFIKQFLQRLTR